MASETDSQVLERYRLARDRLLQAIEAGEQTLEIQGRDGRRRRIEDPIRELETVEQMIVYYQNRVDTASSGRARNLAQLHRR